ncbi:MAG: PepSY domain-containing protein [Methylococcaceae bacterium]|nr:PepSY domain-containing protein [Methylococcaceae bacterium]
MKLRPVWVLIHRYTGLAMTVFLIIVGLTGSLLAFYAELEHAINPQFQVEANGRERLRIPALVAQAERLTPEVKAESVWLDESSGTAQVSVSPRTNPAYNKSYELAFDQLILNAYTGEELGRRTWGDISQGLVNLMPFIYKLHYALALDEIGMWILGITALVWTLDCYVGFYLTLPANRKIKHQTNLYPQGKGAKSFWQRWSPAWQIKWSASTNRINFDLHRAGGLWLWLALLVFAWSSVYMNLGDSVYKTVMKAVSEFHEPWADIDDLSQPLDNPKMGWNDAYYRAENALTVAADSRGIRIEQPVGLWLNRTKGFYVLSARSSADIQDRHGNTRAVIDADTGETLMVLFPTGQYGGNTVTSWLFALHMGNVFGYPYRVFVCVLGVAIVMLSVTGVVIWLRKRRASGYRQKAAGKLAAQSVSILTDDPDYAADSRKNNRI